MSVTFKLNHAETRWGQRANVVGNISQLGKWDPKKGYQLDWGTYPKWENKREQIKISSKEEAAKFEYKYVISDKRSDNLIWEKGINRTVDLTEYFDKGLDVVIEDLFFNAGGCPPKVYTKSKSVESKKSEACKEDKVLSKSVDKVESKKDVKNSSSDKGTKLKVIFMLNHAETNWGQTLNLVGCTDALGCWTTEGSHKMNSINTYPRWNNSLELEIDSKEDAKNIEYKYFIHDNKKNKNNWEKGINRKVDLSSYFGKSDVIVVEDMFFGAQGCAPEVYKARDDQKFAPEK